MIKYLLGMVVTTVLLFILFSQDIKASTVNFLDKHEIQNHLEQTYKVQYSLTEKHHSWEGAKTKLLDYMGEEITNELMQEHMFLEEDGYIFNATDFSIFIVPRFSYNNNTKMIFNEKEKVIYVYELFTGTGPVIFENKYEIVTMKQDEVGWRISNISFEDDPPLEIEERMVRENDKRLVRQREEETLNNKKIGIVKNDSIKKLFDIGLNQSRVQLLYGGNEMVKTSQLRPFYKLLRIFPYGMIELDHPAIEINRQRFSPYTSFLLF